MKLHPNLRFYIAASLSLALLTATAIAANTHSPAPAPAQSVKALAPTAAPAPTANKAPLIIGTGAVTGIYYPAAGAVQRVVNDQGGDLRLAVESTNGSVSNLQALISGKLDLDCPVRLELLRH